MKLQANRFLGLSLEKFHELPEQFRKVRLQLVAPGLNEAVRFVKQSHENVWASEIIPTGLPGQANG